MLYAPSNVSVIEFPMKPHCNRCFGYLAVALGMDYWVVPEISTFYHLKYSASSKKAEAVAETLRHVLVARGSEHLLTPAKRDAEEL